MLALIGRIEGFVVDRRRRHGRGWLARWIEPAVRAPGRGVAAGV